MRRAQTFPRKTFTGDYILHPTSGYILPAVQKEHYFRRFGTRLYRELGDFVRTQLLVGFLLAALILWWQIHTGVITRPNVHSTIVSLLWPYAVVLGLFGTYHIGRTAYLLDRESQNEITKLEDQLVSGDEIGGPQLLIGFSEPSYGQGCLAVINHGGGWAHNVSLRMAGDSGNEISTRDTNVLRDDGQMASWQAGDENRIIADDIIMAGAHESAAIVRCMDADGMWFEYRFEPRDKLGGYRFMGKKRLGKITPP